MKSNLITPDRPTRPSSPLTPFPFPRLANLLLLTVAAFISQSVFAGAGSSGGAKSLVCRNPEGHILRVRILDLAEAEATGRELREPFQSLREEYLENLRRLRRQVGDQRPVNDLEYSKFESQVLRRFQVVAPVDPRLKDTSDVWSTNVKLAKGCALEQLAYWDDSIDHIFVNSELISRLGIQDQGALVLHELLYQKQREGGALFSRRVRQYVAATYSENFYRAYRPLGHPRSRPGIVCEATFFDEVLGRRGHALRARFNPPTTDGQTRVDFDVFNGVSYFEIYTVLPFSLVPKRDFILRRNPRTGRTEMKLWSEGHDFSDGLPIYSPFDRSSILGGNSIRSGRSVSIGNVVLENCFDSTGAPVLNSI